MTTTSSAATPPVRAPGGPAETEPEPLSIGAAAAGAGISVDTVRYYDRCGLLEDLARDAGGNRRFTAADVGWLRVLRCLRSTGMTIQDLRRFCAVDVRTEPERRLRQLQEHEAAVRARMRQLDEELRVIGGKIDAYRDVVAAFEGDHGGETGTPVVGQVPS